MTDLSKVAAEVPPEPFDAEKARAALHEFAISLYRDGYLQPAAAIARFLIGECSSLDQAFGLIRQRPGPEIGSTLQRDVAVLESLLAGDSINGISEKMRMDRTDIRGLRDGSGRYHDRSVAARAEILARKLDGQGEQKT